MASPSARLTAAETMSSLRSTTTWRLDFILLMSELVINIEVLTAMASATRAWPSLTAPWRSGTRPTIAASNNRLTSIPVSPSTILNRALCRVRNCLMRVNITVSPRILNGLQAPLLSTSVYYSSSFLSSTMDSSDSSSSSSSSSFFPILASTGNGSMNAHAGMEESRPRNGATVGFPHCICSLHVSGQR